MLDRGKTGSLGRGGERNRDKVLFFSSREQVVGEQVWQCGAEPSAGEAV